MKNAQIRYYGAGRNNGLERFLKVKRYFFKVSTYIAIAAIHANDFTVLQCAHLLPLIFHLRKGRLNIQTAQKTFQTA